jgi:hypothetical protein
MTRKKTLQRWEKKIGDPEITPQAIKPTAKFFIKMD